MVTTPRTPQVADAEVIVSFVEDGTGSDAVRVTATATIAIDGGLATRVDRDYDGIVMLDQLNLDEDLEHAIRDAVHQLETALTAAGMAGGLDASAMPRAFRF